MLESLITSKTRIKILFKLFLNENSTSHLRGLEKEFGESSNSIRIELNRLIEAGLLSSEQIKNRRVYKANTKHPLYGSINDMLRKIVGIDKLIERVTSKIGNLEAAYLLGEFASGHDSDTIELALVGYNLDEQYIKNLVNKAEEKIDRNIVYVLFTPEQLSWFLKDRDKLLIWKKDNGKVVSN
ncbi:MAG: ArsR family transcriptional regulator [Bacteroidota bacterium]